MEKKECNNTLSEAAASHGDPMKVDDFIWYQYLGDQQIFLNEASLSFLVRPLGN